MDLRTPTGLVFDLPYGSWMGDILKLRAKHEPARLGFPIEITVVGSSGLGWLSSTNEVDAVLTEVRRIARETPPFSFSFKAVERFPNSNVYYLAVNEPEPFHAVQRKLVTSTLSFENTLHEYVPHCTIAILPHNATEAVHREVAACAIPRQRILVASVSLYSVDFERNECEQWDRIPLGF
jgi:hypothetical protein